jgi:hypothetical protein
MYSGHKVSVSLSYVTVRGEGKMERARGSKTPYMLLLLLPPHISVGWPPMCVFVTVNVAQRYLATSIVLLERRIIIKICV